MRLSLTVGLFFFALAVAPISAQPKGDKEKPAATPTSRVILSSLQVEVAGSDFTGPIKFSELLDLAREKLKSNGREVTFAVDDDAFREENNEPVISNQGIHLKNLPAKTTIMHVLRQSLKLVPIKSAIVVRAGRVDIVPLSRTSKEYMLNQTFHVDFKDRPLTLALEELSDLNGVSIVIDARAKQKAQTPVTARFHDDVALQDAVRMLTEMAELKIVYLVTGIYITTPEHAAVMQKELKQIYEGLQTTPGAPPGPGGLGGVPPGFGPPPFPYYPPGESPLAPPLPPARKRLDPGAA
jgi:hypothetical protein